MELLSDEYTKKPVLIEFFAEWCDPCQTMVPVLDKVEQEFREMISVVRVDVDKNPSLRASFRVQSVPTIVLWKNGKTVWRRAGLISVHELKKCVKRTLIT